LLLALLAVGLLLMTWLFARRFVQGLRTGVARSPGGVFLEASRTGQPILFWLLTGANGLLTLLMLAGLAIIAVRLSV
jgi:hypothetical protein